MVIQVLEGGENKDFEEGWSGCVQGSARRPVGRPGVG